MKIQNFLWLEFYFSIQPTSYLIVRWIFFIRITFKSSWIEVLFSFRVVKMDLDIACNCWKHCLSRDSSKLQSVKVVYIQHNLSSVSIFLSGISSLNLNLLVQLITSFSRDYFHRYMSDRLSFHLKDLVTFISTQRNPELLPMKIDFCWQDKFFNLLPSSGNKLQ